MGLLPRVSSITELAELIGSLARRLAVIEPMAHSHKHKKTQTFTPGNMTVGTGGAATYDYRYIGGGNVGDRGTLIIGEGRITLGTGFTITGNPLIGLPSGYEIDTLSTGLNRFGLCSFGVNNSFGAVSRASATQILLTALNVAGTYLVASTLSTTVPGTWASGDVMVFNAVVPVVRV